MFRHWIEILKGCQLASLEDTDKVSRWLLASQSCVVIITLISALIGGLTALKYSGFSILNLILATIGLILAHTAHNLMNEYFDYRSGIDKLEDADKSNLSNPITNGLLTTQQLWTAVILVMVIDFMIAVYFALSVTPYIIIFAILGLFLSIFYSAPPIRLKGRGLGEIASFLVWGPLITLGTFLAVLGYIEINVIWVSIPFGLLAMTILTGNHLDKIELHKNRGIKTMPVRIGVVGSIYVIKVATLIYLAFSIILYSTGTIGPAIILIWAALPLMLKAITNIEKPKSSQDVANNPLISIWYTAWTFRMTRLAGLLFVLAIIIDLLYFYFT
jgi:1,4-dihydroxy-2-naphthoate polyprenyltransferase